MSIASLSKNVQVMAQAGLSGTEQYKAMKKSIEGVEISTEKLQTLKNKVKKLDPNQESLNNIRVKVSQS